MMDVGGKILALDASPFEFGHRKNNIGKTAPLSGNSLPRLSLKCQL
jgi:hypothetical protein